MAQGASEQVRSELGPEFDDVDWRKLDPRQYDPRRIVREALADLPGPWRDAFLLSRVDGLTRAEIAARLGVSVKTVERNIARALGHCLSRVERDPGGGVSPGRPLVRLTGEERDP